jgi:hypothetical protein
MNVFARLAIAVAESPSPDSTRASASVWAGQQATGQKRSIARSCLGMQARGLLAPKGMFLDRAVAPDRLSSTNRA